MKQKILLAEDDKQVRRLVGRILGSELYEILPAEDGAKAVEIALRDSPDLVVLDLGMPGKTGWQVLRELRQGPRTRLIPVIILTGTGGNASEIAALRRGADDFIAKPFSGAELAARVRSVLRRAGQEIAANPLTRLPGIPDIKEEVEARIRSKASFAFLYADIDRFKAYNDAYGFEAGNQAIIATADILQESLKAKASPGAFLGHIGGDDFALVVDEESAPFVALDAVRRFDGTIPMLYAPVERVQGYVEIAGTEGSSVRRPGLMTLSIGAASSRWRRLESYGAVARIASEMKGFLKKRPGDRISRFAFDRGEDRR